MLVIGQFDLDAGVVLDEARHLAVPQNLDAEVGDPVREDRLELLLRQCQHVVVAGGEIGDVEPDPAVTMGRDGESGVEKSIRDAALIEHLDGAGEQPEGPRTLDILGTPSFHHDAVDTRQRELPGQHQPGRTAAGDHHRMFGHPTSARQPGDSAPPPWLCRKPPPALYVESGRASAPDANPSQGHPRLDEPISTLPVSSGVRIQTSLTALTPGSWRLTRLNRGDTASAMSCGT